jgi:hypothetical protein
MWFETLLWRHLQKYVSHPTAILTSVCEDFGRTHPQCTATCLDSGKVNGFETLKLSKRDRRLALIQIWRELHTVEMLGSCLGDSEFVIPQQLVD